MQRPAKNGCILLSFCMKMGQCQIISNLWLNGALYPVEKLRHSWKHCVWFKGSARTWAKTNDTLEIPAIILNTHQWATTVPFTSTRINLHILCSPSTKHISCNIEILYNACTVFVGPQREASFLQCFWWRLVIFESSCTSESFGE